LPVAALGDRDLEKRAVAGVADALDHCRSRRPPSMLAELDAAAQLIELIIGE
jgi:hypothetical protein